MKLSTKSRYGLRALVEIAKLYGSVPAKRKDIATKQGLSNSYLENLLIILKNNRLIDTIRGVNGGYVLSRSPSEIQVYDVICALEGPFEIADCTGEFASCDRDVSCATHIVWKELYESWVSILNKYTLQDLIDLDSARSSSDYVI